MNLLTSMACIFTCDPQDIVTGTECNTRGGLRCAYYARREDIDWDATAANYDPATNLVSGFVMLGGATFKRLEFNRKVGSYTATYTRDNGYYEVNINLLFDGKSATRSKAICDSLNCCDLVMVLFDNNCQGRLIGVDWDGTAFDAPVEGLHISDDEDNYGAFGGDVPQDSITFSTDQICRPVHIDIDKTDFETNYA